MKEQMEFGEFYDWIKYHNLQFRVVTGKIYKNRVEIWQKIRPHAVFSGEADVLEMAFAVAHDNYRQGQYD